MASAPLPTQGDPRAQGDAIPVRSHAILRWTRGTRSSRRQTLALAVAGVAGGLAAQVGLIPTAAKKKKKITICFNGQTQKVAKKGFASKFPGATKGACATCPPGSSVGAVSVPATGGTVSTPVLASGQKYRLRATGFWITNATHGNDATADFLLANPADLANVVKIFNGVRLGLSVDGGSPDVWGEYNVAHTYEREVTGTGAALTLKYTDPITTDNSGSLSVEVFCV